MPSFETTRFGVLEYAEEAVIQLQEGLIGLPKLQRWLLLDMDDAMPMRWLQSLDRADFGVPVMPPVFFADVYEIDTKRISALGEEAEAVTLIIATVHPGGERITGNLRAPLVIDTGSRRGAQIALADDRLSTRQDIDYFKFGLAVSGAPLENDLADGETASSEAEATSAEAETAVPGI
jgi:flagellar assembly factor FliW